MTGSPIEEIKTRLDIVEFIQTYVRLQKAGMNFRAPCPFHAEKTPSFFVSPTRQTWHCFGGCGEGGDIFKFVMKIEGLDFPEALRFLAGRAGVVLKREDPSLRSERNRLYDICETATGIFERNLLMNSAVKEYLKKRGMREGTVRGFRIGFAVQSWDSLLSALVKKGFKKEEVEKTGMAVRSEDGSSHYDRFRGRIMFPISDPNGRVIGFGGRIFGSAADIALASSVKSPKGQRGTGHVAPISGNVGSGTAKYINTPQTMIYDKSRVLYGFDKAKQEIRARGSAVVVEGYMDCVMSHQGGVKNTIAVSGTALTSQQLTALKRLCDTLVFSFDADLAGENATRRSLMLAAGFELERRIAAIPSGKDPADAVLENPDVWVSAVADAKPVVDFYFEKAFREMNPERAEGKKKISSLLIPLIAELKNEIERAHWVRELAKRFQIGEDAVWKEVARRPGEAPYSGLAGGASGEGAFEAPLRRELLEERFLALLAAVPDEIRRQGSERGHVSFASSARENLFVALADGNAPATEIAELLESVRFRGELIAASVPDAAGELALCRRELEKECIKDELVKLGMEISAHERAGTDKDVQPLLENFRLLSEQLKTLS